MVTATALSASKAVTAQEFRAGIAALGLNSPHARTRGWPLPLAGCQVREVCGYRGDMNTPCPNTKSGRHPRSSASCPYCSPRAAASVASVASLPAPAPGVLRGRVAELRDHAAQAAAPAELPDDMTGQTVVENAHRIYEWMTDNGMSEDSWTRECLFSYASEDTGRDYDEFYDAWLEGKPLS